MNKFKLLALFLITLLVNATSIFAQNNNSNALYLKHETLRLDKNVNSLKDISDIDKNEIFEGRFYRFMQFIELPTTKQIKELNRLRINLLEYIPHNTYVASIPVDINFNDLKTLNIRSISIIPISVKMDIRLADFPFPEWATDREGIRVLIQYYQDINKQNVISEFDKLRIPILQEIDNSNLMIVHIKSSQINELASLAFVRYIDFESEPGKPESDDGRNLHRANAIDVDYNSAYHFDGTGVSVAINDDGYVGPHIDFKGRTDQTDVQNDFSGSHGDMTVGIVGAAGNLNPIMRGMATGAFLWVRAYSSSLPNTVSLHQNEDVMVFSSSYSNGCNAGYTSTTQMVDDQIYNNPSLIQVFSAGNSNNNDCGYGAGSEWGNITGGHKMGKNVIATANLYNDDALAGSSSRGPASDGRIKPDIAAHGQGHWSTAPDNTYAAGGGTSAAAPGIAGVLAQLHQAYRTFNSGNDAPSALLKAAILNTAYDLGNPGPDFKYGWGKVNAYKAMKTIEDVRYIADSISNGNTITYNLSVPAGVQEMRVMVYWHDVAASTSALYALVNNLDMTMTDLSGAVHYPLVLDHTPNPVTLNNNAVPGIDSINNVEQVRIQNPAQGNHTISISGTSVPFGPQKYYIVYEYYYNDIMLTYPNGGEGLIPGSSERIFWDAYGNTGNFTAEYTLNNGATWTTISNSIPGDARFADFTVPNTISRAKVRISRNGVSDSSNEEFSIINTPGNIQVNAICSGTNTISIVWNAVTGATSYDVFLLGTMYMDSIATTSNLSFDVPVNNISEDQWISVRARAANGIVGRRATAVVAGGEDCYLDCISDDDAGVDSLLSPNLINESCSGTTIDVSVNLTNIGTNTQSNFPVYYQFDNNTAVADTFTGTLQGNSIEAFTFSVPITNISAGSHTLVVWTALANDGAQCNDTLETTIEFYEALSSLPYTEDFESGVFPPEFMFISNPDNSTTWQESGVTGADGNSTTAAYIDNYHYNDSGQEDILEIISIDLTNSSSASLEFDVAYSTYSSYWQDALRIEASNDCGQTYNQIYYKQGDSLATVSPNISPFYPSSASEWRHDTIDLSAYIGGLLKIRFVNITGYGNGLFIDNIFINDGSPANYCIPTSSCSAGDIIDDFSFNTIIQTNTGCGINGYSDFTNLSTTLVQSGIYTMSLNTNYGNQNVSMWIDFNDDAVFNNTDERVLFDFNLANSGVTYSTDISIPSNANPGNHRMRVRTRWSSSCNDPCTNFTFGETHDYSVYISNTTQAPNVSLGADVSICEGNNADIIPVVNGGLTPYTYIWNTGETVPVINVSPVSQTTYSLTVTDANSNTGSDDITIFVNSLPNVDLGPDLSIAQGSSASLDAGTGFVSYYWNTGETTQLISVSSAGLYSVTVFDGNGCSNSDEIEISYTPSANPGWTYTITGSNHTILIPLNANISIQGNPIEAGDYIGVFFDSLGTLACAGYTVWDGNTTSITAWGQDLGNDGFVVGEEFKWKIWKNSNQIEYYATATYMQPPSMQNTAFFAVNGISGIESLTSSNPGWNYTITGSNHTILVPVNSYITINGNSIEYGDYIGVFFDSLGTLACAGYTFWNGNTTSITAWGEDLGNDGFVVGEQFKWKVWRNSDQTEYYATATYMQPPSMPNTAYFAVNGISGIDTLTAVSPNWNYSITGTNHTILVPASADITIDGNPVEYGDYIGVFFDSLGTLACAGYTFWTGYTTSITAWGEDIGNDGFVVGEEFKWKIWQNSSGLDFEATATYMQPPLMQYTGNFAINGISGIETLSTSNSETQTLLLKQGWSIISSYIIPDYPLLDSVFASVLNHVVIIKDGYGNIFWPQFNINIIGDIDPTQGYQIRMLVQEYLDVTGVAANPATTVMNIPSGWSIMGYLHSVPANLELMLNPILPYITIVKDGNGFIYWPAYGLNFIGDLKPGEGYQINMSQAQQFYYPLATNSNQKQSINIPESLHFGKAQNTGVNMSICIPLTAWDELPQYGSEVGFFTNDGILVGSTVFENRNIALSVWGNDKYSADKNGLYNDEAFSIKLFNESEEELFISSWLQGDEYFDANKISIAEKIINKNDFNGILEIYPNPASDKVSVSFKISNDDDIVIELYNAIGERIEVLPKQHYLSGSHTIELKTNQLANGDYYFRFLCSQFVDTKNIQIMYMR